MRLRYVTHHPGETPPPPPPPSNFAFQFPRNDESPLGEFCAFQLRQPQLNGLPIWGPANAGVTYIWKCMPLSSNEGYYTTFFYAQSNGEINFTNDTPYYGAHPYPPGGMTGTTHVWEIPIDGGDVTTTNAGGTASVTKDSVRVQALQVTHNGGTKTLRFYTNLPSTASNSIIVATASSGYGNSYAGGVSFAITFGDAPWAHGYEWLTERGMCLDAVKIIAKSMSQADIITESGSFSSLLTSDAINNIWWGKDGFDDTDDLTCDFGTGRSAQWPDGNVNRPSLISRL